jgi:GTP-binding protein
MRSRRCSCCTRRARRRKREAAPGTGTLSGGEGGGVIVKLKSVEFAGAIGRPGQDPPGTLPQVAFAGRSNVGKSSLINRLLERHRKQIARVSASPGKTQEINFYRIVADLGDEAAEFFLVDLPGYGYARAPVSVRDSWRPLIERYLGGSADLLGVVQLLDARHDPTAEDLKMVQYLASIEMPTLFVLTKVDKLKPLERERRMKVAVAQLQVELEQIIPFSSTTGEGRAELLEALTHLLTGD